MHVRIILVALALALAAPVMQGCPLVKDVRSGDVEAPRDEAVRALAGGYEALAAARETVLVLYASDFLSRSKALAARDALNEVDAALVDADRLVDSGLIQAALLQIAAAKARIESILTEAEQ